MTELTLPLQGTDRLQQPDRNRFRRQPAQWIPPALLRRSSLVLGGFLALALLGGMLLVRAPVDALVALVVLAITVWVYCRPAAAAYLVILLTPLLAGMDRGSVIPFFRPNEAVDLWVGGVLCLRGLVRLRSGEIPRLRLDSLEWSLVAMAICSSVIPLIWMYIRGVSPTSDDVLYALVLWKYFGLYLLARFSIRTNAEVRWALWLSLAGCTIVCGVGVLQALKLFGVPKLLSTYYAPFGIDGALTISRGSSLLALPAAVADLAIMNLAIVVGLLMRKMGDRRLLFALGGLFLFGILASGEFSAVIAFVAAAFAVGMAIGMGRMLSFAIPGMAAGGLALKPVVETRLAGFQSSSGLPVSWIGRIDDLRTYFWPTLFTNFNWILGVRPAARVVVSSRAYGYVWIESGYTWLLWGGGIPLLASYFVFVWIAMRRAWGLLHVPDVVGVAALGIFALLASQLVSMLFDPHLTYRGAADLLFLMLALARPQRLGEQAPQTSGVAS